MFTSVRMCEAGILFRRNLLIVESSGFTFNRILSILEFWIKQIIKQIVLVIKQKNGYLLLIKYDWRLKRI